MITSSSRARRHGVGAARRRRRPARARAGDRVRSRAAGRSPDAVPAPIAGPETKTLLVYDEPFWRADGFSGQSAEPQSASEVTLDASPAAGTPGVIASFTFGPVAERVDALDAGERRGGPRRDGRPVRPARRRRRPSSSRPRGGRRSGRAAARWRTSPPGLLTRYGSLLREPFGRVHWAGTETATISYGAIDGAIRSGERAAGEILAAA